MACSSSAAPAFAATSPWVKGEKTKARLISGRAANADGGGLFAFVDIALEPGWKTYWRTPGDAGGLPPTFDWSKSTNVAATVVKFPAPELFTDKSGNTIGYKDGVTLPVALTLKDAGQPATLKIELGVPQATPAANVKPQGASTAAPGGPTPHGPMAPTRKANESAEPAPVELPPATDPPPRATGRAR